MKKLCEIVVLLLMANMAFAQEYSYSKDSPLPCVDKTFSIYFHVVLDSTGKDPLNADAYQVIIDKMNKAFAPVCIQFAHCSTNRIKDYSFEKIKLENKIDLMVNRWHVENRINIYIVKSLGFANSYSIFNGISEPDKGLIVIPRSTIGLIHELGHLFGLYHTFETKFGKELVNGSNCTTAGDMICDTPADPYTNDFPPSTFINSKCEFIYNNKDSNAQYYLTEIGNYMSHYYCAHCYFSKAQYIKMVNNYLTAEFKMW